LSSNTIKSSNAYILLFEFFRDDNENYIKTDSMNMTQGGTTTTTTTEDKSAAAAAGFIRVSND